MDRTEEYYVASQWRLMRLKFGKHKIAISSVVFLALIYGISIFCEFFSPYDIYRRFIDYSYCPPQRIRIFDEGKFNLRPFVYGWKISRHPETRRRIFEVDREKKYPIHFFVKGDSYKILGLFESNVHFFGVKEENGVLFLFGTERLGRDLLSRNLTAARISLSVGLVGVAISFILGLILGGISGFLGGRVDTLIQRTIEVLLSVPTIPLWMALSAALPSEWPPIKVYFGITVILSVVGWTALARVVRGKLLQLREEDFIMAARIGGMRNFAIITRHLMPSFLSYFIVNLTLRIPQMILGETALSFLGLGIRPPAVSWGTLLQDAQDMQSLTLYPWLLIPAILVVVAVLAFNFVGDGLRDAADPYK